MRHDNIIKSLQIWCLAGVLVPCLTGALMSGSCQAQLLYDFVSHGDVLATLELRSLPAEPGDFVGLTFTPAGETVFRTRLSLYGVVRLGGWGQDWESGRTWRGGARARRGLPG